MKHVVIILLAVSSAGACRYGMTAEKFTPASSPHGVAARVTTADAVLTGELLQVQDAGLLLLTPSVDSPPTTPNCRVRLVRYPAIRAARFDQLGEDYGIAGAPPSPKIEERLRLVSRFPHGLAPELLNDLLAACGQTEVEGVAP
jgi:hypothetical protein